VKFRIDQRSVKCQRNNLFTENCLLIMFEGSPVFSRLWSVAQILLLILVNLFVEYPLMFAVYLQH